MARNPPACPAEKRSLGENLVNDRRNPAQVRLRTETGMWLNFIVLKFRLGSASEPNLCSHCCSVPYMEIPAKDQVMLLINVFQTQNISYYNSIELNGTLLIMKCVIDQSVKGIVVWSFSIKCYQIQQFNRCRFLCHSRGNVTIITTVAF